MTFFKDRRFDLHKSRLLTAMTANRTKAAADRVGWSLFLILTCCFCWYDEAVEAFVPLPLLLSQQQLLLLQSSSRSSNTNFDTTNPRVCMSARRVHHDGDCNDKKKPTSSADANVMDRWHQKGIQAVGSAALCLCLTFSPQLDNNIVNQNTIGWIAQAAESSSSTTTVISTSTTTSNKKYDGFAEYAQENQMQQSDVGCFINKCGDQTKALFSNPRGIKGVSCLGRCKGEQSCATRCFAEYGSDDLNNWLSCTIEDYECVKVPKNIDNSAENVGYRTAIRRNFDPSTLQGVWYKTDGLNPNYDLFDCQTNRFTTIAKTTTTSGEQQQQRPRELDMDIFFRVSRPEGGFWENALTEHMVVDDAVDDRTTTNRGSFALGAVDAADAADTESSNDDDNDRSSNSRPTMHTSGKMYGLKFEENWYILGESDGKGDIPPFKLVAYKGHTLQGNYEGAFVYAKEPVLPPAAIPAVRMAATKAGFDFDKFTRIDNTCPPGEALNDASAGTGTSTTDWIDLVVGEGGVIDWISPGWRGEYKHKKV